MKRRAFIHIIRNVLRRAGRTPAKSALIAVAAAGFIFALSRISSDIKINAEKVDLLYESTSVTGMAVTSSANAYVADGGVISARTVGKIMDTGFILDAYREAAIKMSVAAPDERLEAIPGAESFIVNLRGFAKPELFDPIKSGKVRAGYSEGYDEDFFRRETSGFLSAYKDERIGEVLLSLEISQKLGVDVGGHVRIASVDVNEPGRIYKVVGAFVFTPGMFDSMSFDILVPLADIEAHLKMDLRYARAEFTLDPAKNRELDVFRKAIGEIFAQPMDTKLTFVLRDEALREVVEPLNRSIELMKLLYPIVLAVSALIAAALSTLLILQSAKEAAVMRVLGTSKRRVMAILICEQGMLCVFGILAGTVSAVFFGGADIFAAEIYLAGCLAAAFFSALIVAGRKPLELLQTKE